MSTGKFINEIIYSCFSAGFFSLKYMGVTHLSLVMEFLGNVFSNFIFEKLLLH